MRRTGGMWLLLLLVMGALAAPLPSPLAAPWAAARAADSVWVRVLPASGSYAVGDEIQVEVWIEDVVDLYGADVRLSFDAAHLQVLDANPVQAGVQILPRDDLLSPDFVLLNQADNMAGTVWYAATQVNPTPPASGSGVVCAFAFRVIGSGITQVGVAYQKLAAPGGVAIPADAAGAEYQLEGQHWVFLPQIVARH